MHLPQPSTFDRAAATFGRYRALPDGVPEAIRRAVWSAASRRSAARVLDLGAGTGRFGRAFVDAGDAYVGVDLSPAMLREFLADCRTARLVLGSGQRLPFPGDAFGVVLLMHVVGGADDWRGLLDEALRVVAPSGTIVIGQTVAPPNGVDDQLRRHLAEVLEETGTAVHRPRHSREQSLAWLESATAGRVRAIAASWIAQRTPREFIARHRTGVRFAALPPAVQEDALQTLSTWAQGTFGSLDTVFAEEHRFELDLFETHPRG